MKDDIHIHAARRRNGPPDLYTKTAEPRWSRRTSEGSRQWAAPRGSRLHYGENGASGRPLGRELRRLLYAFGFDAL